jgi:8-oxo-dGTP diphosphatase
MTTVSGRFEPLSPDSGAYPDKPRVAVGAVVIRDEAVLLVRRGKPPGEGRWAIPGGSVRLGESLQAAAERELLEETGVTVKAGQPVLTFETIRKDAAGRVAYHYIIIDLEADYVAGRPQAADDAADARWVTKDELPELDVVPATRRFLCKHYGFGCPP